MENVNRPLFPMITKSMVLPFAVGMLLCSNSASAANELTQNVNATAQGQHKTQVTGVIVDANGEPLIGVSVVEKGNKSNGAVTDADGKY